MGMFERKKIVLLVSLICVSQQAANVQDANSKSTSTELKVVKPQKRVTPVKDAEKLSILRTQDNSLDLNTNGEEVWDELTHNIPLEYIEKIYNELNQLAQNENRPKRLWGATAAINTDNLNPEVENELENKKNAPVIEKFERPIGLWHKDVETKNPENRLPLGLWGKDSEPLPIGLWGKDADVNDDLKKEPLPIGLWGKDIDSTQEDNKPNAYKGKLPIGLWGKDNALTNDFGKKNNGKDSGPPPGLWGKDSKPIPGLWGKDNGPMTGLWGKKDVGPPPGLWGKKDQPPIGMWGRAGKKDSNPYPGLWGKKEEEIENVDKEFKEDSLEEYPACLFENPPCEIQEKRYKIEKSGPPPGLWGKRSEKYSMNKPPWRGGMWGRSEILENSVHDSKQTNTIDMELSLIHI